MSGWRSQPVCIGDALGCAESYQSLDPAFQKRCRPRNARHSERLDLRDKSRDVRTRDAARHRPFNRHGPTARVSANLNKQLFPCFTEAPRSVFRPLVRGPVPSSPAPSVGENPAPPLHRVGETCVSPCHSNGTSPRQPVTPTSHAGWRWLGAPSANGLLDENGAGIRQALISGWG